MPHDYAKYKSVPFEKIRTTCEVCQSSDLKSVLRWNKFPLTELYPPKDVDSLPDWGRADLELDYCNHCSHVQLKNIVSQDWLYGNKSDYIFRASLSKSAVKSYSYFLDFMHKSLQKECFGKVLEVGCNDLFLVNQAANVYSEYLGVDPVLSKLTDLKLPSNCAVKADFFENVELDFQPDVVICKDVIEHVVEPAKLLRSIVEKCSDNTVFAVQVPIAETICQYKRFDQVFHQHLNYFTYNSFQSMLCDLSCELIDFDINHFHWGVGIFLFKKGNPSGLREQLKLDDIKSAYSEFEQRMCIANSAVLASSNDSKIYLFGAGLMLSVYGYHIPSLASRTTAIIDDNPEKQQTLCMQLPVPIVASGQVGDWSKVTVVLGAVSSRENVLSMLNHVINWQPRNVINPIYLI